MIIAFLITTHYTSWLYSKVTVKKVTYPVTGFESLLEDGSYTLGLFEGGAMHTEIEVRMEGKLLICLQHLPSK